MSDVASPYWLQFIQPFATVAVGIGAFTIAYRQWRLSNEKLLFDLYQLRIVLYRRFMIALDEVIRNKQVPDTVLKEFVEIRAEALMLFDNDIGELIDNLFSAIRPLASGVDEEHNVRAVRDIRARARPLFSNYLRLTVKKPKWPIK